MTRLDIGISLLCAFALLLVRLFRREAHFAWAAQGRAIERAMKAEDELADIRSRNSARSRLAAQTRRSKRLATEAELALATTNLTEGTIA